MSFDPKLRQLVSSSTMSNNNPKVNTSLGTPTSSNNNNNNNNNENMKNQSSKMQSGNNNNNYNNKNMMMATDTTGIDHQDVDANALALTMLPRLQGVLRGLFSGPHTQFACACLAAFAPVNTSSGNDMMYDNYNSMKKNRDSNQGPQPYIVKHVIIVVTCTQIFVCDDHAFVHRVIHLERLLAVYLRPADSTKLSGASQQDSNHFNNTSRPKEGSELEILLVVDGEHDLLLQGRMTCDGIPPKPLVPLLQVLHENVKPVAPLVVHSNNPAPLSEIARLQVPLTYKAPLPIREETNENCPCWREGDVINISMQEFEQRVANIFTVYAPERLPTVKEVCKRFAHRKGGALQHLVDKYGPEPTAEHAGAVAAVLSRESVNQSLFAQQSSKQPTFSAITATQRSNESAPKEIPVDPLYFPALILMQRPSGGSNRVQLHISPAPSIPQGLSAFSPYIRAGYLDGYRTKEKAGQIKEREFWSLSNEGFALSFDISNDALRPFGFAHGDRVLATVGVTSGKMSTVIGVRDGTLWVHDDGTLGACAMVGFRSHEDLERLNGWMLVESAHLSELKEMEVITEGGFVETLDITPETLFPNFGFFHGEVVASKKACSQPTTEAVILGVARTGELYVQWLITSDAQLQEYKMKQMQTTSGGNLGGGNNNNNSSSFNNQKGNPNIMAQQAASKPLLAVDLDSSSSANNLSVFQRKKLPQKESGAVARNAISVGTWRSKEDLIKSHGWVPVGCRKVCVARAMKETPSSPPTI